MNLCTTNFISPKNILNKRECIVKSGFENFICSKVSSMKVLVERKTRQNLKMTLLGQNLLPVSATVQTRLCWIIHPRAFGWQTSSWWCLIFCLFVCKSYVYICVRGTLSMYMNHRCTTTFPKRVKTAQRQMMLCSFVFLKNEWKKFFFI